MAENSTNAGRWVPPALEAFGLAGAGVRGIGAVDGDGWTTRHYQVDEPSGGRWLLGLTDPGGRKPEDVRGHYRSHLLWLLALDRDSGITVQVPRPSVSGDLVVSLGPSSGERLASLLTWVEGSPLWPEGGDPDPDSLRDLGGLLARLHHHGESWRRPEDVVLPYAGSDDLEETLERFYPAMADGGLSGGDAFQVESVLNAVDDHLRKIERSGSSRGPLHGAFTSRSCVRLRDDLRPVGFDRCCIGWYLSEIGSLFDVDRLAPPHRRHVLDGYDAVRPLPGHAMRTIEGFLIQSRISRSAESGFGADEFHDFLWDECARYIAGYPFLLEDEDPSAI